MYVYEVIPGAYEFISIISFFKTYSNGYFRKQQNETGYFFGMTLGKAKQNSFNIPCIYHLIS